MGEIIIAILCAGCGLIVAGYVFIVVLKTIDSEDDYGKFNKDKKHRWK